jgi:N-acyl-L-homoserine lactone synthetase
MKPAYDLDDKTMRGLSAMALAAHPATGRFTALVVGPRDLMADVARTVERQVYEAAFGNDAATMAAEYAAYEQASLFFLVLDRTTGRPAGAGRVIDGGGRTLDDAPDLTGVDLSAMVLAHAMHDGKIWDFATIAVLPAYRGGRSGLTVSALLYRTFINASRRAGVRHIVTMLDHRAQRNMALLGVPLAPLGGSDSFAHLGSPKTTALYVAFADLEPAIAEQGARLGRLGASFAGEIRHRGLRRLLTRRIAARVSAQVSTGEGLDEHIRMPALERRRLAHRR